MDENKYGGKTNQRASTMIHQERQRQARNRATVHGAQSERTVRPVSCDRHSDAKRCWRQQPEAGVRTNDSGVGDKEAARQVMNAQSHDEAKDVGHN